MVKKAAHIHIKTTTKRSEVIKTYAAKAEKTVTQLLEEHIDSLERKLAKK